MKSKNISPAIIIVIFHCILGTFVSSCGSPKNLNYNPVYFKNGSDTITANLKERAIQPNDILSIHVYSKTPNQEQAAIFNIFTSPSSSLPSLSSGLSGVGAVPAGAGSQSPSSLGYRVNEKGSIDMPVIGSVNTSNLTIFQLEDYLSQKIENYVKSPVVVVHYQQFDVNVLGEVKVPGIKKFTNDRVTIIDAISASGDLTDYAKRNDITVIRAEGGKKVFYKADIRDRNIFKSPVFLLQPNDIVYVNPDKYKLETLGVSPKAQRNTALIFGVLGISISIATLLVTLIK